MIITPSGAELVAAGEQSRLCVGVDIVAVARTARWVRRYRPELQYVFTAAEREQADDSRYPEQVYALCFGAKEAVGKALSCGLAGIEWTDVEATVTPHQLLLRLTGAAAALATGHGVDRWLGSWSRAGDLVFVCALGCAP
ncbi:MAG: holo-ACP synthase [Pseudonocardiaceae bacterium]